ncbi:contact-dependent growth inhibition system immunity protein [Exercitatus varius]|uniref:contact-dependent growth inhibition system immunity protein n=1 Tax=Exercitatus varius TaxID=67857 RepID=UPI0018A3DA28|nr:contact-dependent growth inhibition system immunity protein [Exercitatus varius]MDG2944691.1 contact-dependent growth inhibition system immunity protein [Exercitatus varius]QOF67466.1 CdiI family contact-dependent growth inhibition immunity protein [Actinobacillus sp. GY-402]
MKKGVFIELTSNYISIASELKGRMTVINPSQEVSYLDTKITDLNLGVEIKKKLSESHEITEDVFMNYWENRDEFNKKLQLKEEKIIKLYRYKNRKSLYKDTLFLSIGITNNILFITPLHQDGLGTFGTVRDKDGKGVEFEYPVNLSDEELGKAVKEAFGYCTSIYRK